MPRVPACQTNTSGSTLPARYKGCRGASSSGVRGGSRPRGRGHAQRLRGRGSLSQGGLELRRREVHLPGGAARGGGGSGAGRPSGVRSRGQAGRAEGGPEPRAPGASERARRVPAALTDPRRQGGGGRRAALSRGLLPQARLPSASRRRR